MSAPNTSVSIAMVAAILLAVIPPSAVIAKSKVVAQKQMSFAACLEMIRRTATQLRHTPVNVVETNIVRIVRFRVSNGSILVTCSKPDQKMLIIQSN